jgi:hypothetical protein
MPTIIGVIFFCCAAYCFLFKQDGLLGLLIIASIFEAASAINIGERGIQPYYVVAAFLIARALINFMLGARSNKPMPQGKWLLLFGAIGVASAFILPIVFAGIPVYDPKVGIDDGMLIRPPLTFGLNNVAQAGFLACHIASAYAVLAIGFSSIKARKIYLWAFYLVVFILAAQSVCQFAGIPFPHSLILNNPGYALWDASGEVSGTRNPGSFSEPSVAGAFLVLYCVGFLAQYVAGKGGTFHLVVSLLASGLVASGGSIFTLCLITVPVLFSYFPFRFPWYINIRRTKRLAWVGFVLFTPIALALLSSGYSDALLTNTVSKKDSLSFINRTASDLYALQLLPRTNYMGTGLGSNRASSLLTTLLSNVGILGVLAFGIFYIRLFAKLQEEYAWFRWAGFALILNMCIGVPDVTMPMLWVPILLAIQFCSGVVPTRQELKPSRPRFKPGAL